MPYTKVNYEDVLLHITTKIKPREHTCLFVLLWTVDRVLLRSNYKMK